MHASVTQLYRHFNMALKKCSTRLTICLVGLVLLELWPRVDLLRELGIPGEDIIDVYNKYREAAGDGSRRSGSRRVLKNNTEYQIHVKRLKGVNGFKTHNLIIRSGGQPNVNKTMYINNPVESSMPQAFLSLDEFKQALINRVQRNRETFDREKLKSAMIKMWKVKRKAIKQISTTKAKIMHVSKIVDSNKTVVNSKPMKSTKKHRQLKLNPVTKEFNASKPLKLNIFTKEQNKTTPTLLQAPVTTGRISIVSNNSSKLVSGNENAILLSNKNFTDENIKETTKTTVETSELTELQSFKQDETVEGTVTVNENKDIVKDTETDVTETTTSGEVTTGEPTTAAALETKALTTESTRATLGRPAVYMGY